MLAEPALARHPALTKLRRQSSRRRLSPSAVAAMLLLIPVVLVASLVLLRGAIVRSVASKVPVDVEISLGRAAAAGIVSTSRVIEDPEAADGLAALTAPLLRGVGTTRYPYTFHVVADATVNAFALPGGEVFVHSGLILRAERPEEVAGVLAHEMAHVEERHAVRSLVQELGLSALASLVLGDASSAQGVLAAAAPELIGLKFSRDFEREADATGFDYLVRAGIDPSGMRDMFRKLAKEHDAGAVDAALSLLSTHPAPADRLELLDGMTATLDGPPAEAIALDFPAFQATIRALAESAAAQ